jgi:pyruvate/2-oxoglutarate dehydrogenase complex dihydrolipoamide dehydrogenase (E3) component
VVAARAAARCWCWAAGPIGCELAQAFARLGSQVTQVEMAPRLMGREDEDVSAFVQHALQADGVQVLTGHQALRCERDGRAQACWWWRRVKQEHRLPFDHMLWPWAAARG